MRVVAVDMFFYEKAFDHCLFTSKFRSLFTYVTYEKYLDF